MRISDWSSDVCSSDLMALANSLALELAGITRDTPDPPGGSIVRDADGEPTGVLKDSAMNAVYAVIPEASPGEIAIALRAAMREANENGVTSVQDMSASPDILRAYRQLLADGELTVRVYGAQPLSRSEEHTSELQSLLRISYAVFCLLKNRTTVSKVE